MADGSYFEGYPTGLDGTSSLIPPITSFRHPGGPQENFDGNDKTSGPGFYTDQYGGMHGGGGGGGESAMVGPGGQATSSMAAMDALGGSGGVPPVSSQDYSALAGMASTSAAAMSTAAMYNDQVAAYGALKPELRQHMPPASHVPMMHSARPSLEDERYLYEREIKESGPSNAVAHAIALTQQTQRRPRSEKKPIPEDLKDNKYFERRKRNNLAAKKSRDARKAREDEIAIRASFLEKENAILRAQVATLREEANSLRQLLLQKRSRP